MLRDRLADYLEQVEEGVRALGNFYVERYDVEVLTPDRINLRIRIRFHMMW